MEQTAAQGKDNLIVYKCSWGGVAKNSTFMYIEREFIHTYIRKTIKFLKAV